jgi:nucleoside permease NupC
MYICPYGGAVYFYVLLLLTTAFISSKKKSKVAISPVHAICQLTIFLSWFYVSLDVLTAKLHFTEHFFKQCF